MLPNTATYYISLLSGGSLLLLRHYLVLREQALSEIHDLISYFREEARREREYSKRLEETATKTHNIMLKVLMKAVSLDSLKHALIYEALADLLRTQG